MGKAFLRDIGIGFISLVISLLFSIGIKTLTTPYGYQIFFYSLIIGSLLIVPLVVIMMLVNSFLKKFKIFSSNPLKNAILILLVYNCIVLLISLFFYLFNASQPINAFLKESVFFNIFISLYVVIKFFSENFKLLKKP